MKRLFLSLIMVLLIAGYSQAASLAVPFFNISSLTFTCASTAKTSTANLRIVAQAWRLAKGANENSSLPKAWPAARP